MVKVVCLSHIILQRLERCNIYRSRTPVDSVDFWDFVVFWATSSINLKK